MSIFEGSPATTSFMIFVSLFSGFLPISKLGHMTSIGTLLAFVVCMGIMAMRHTRPDLPRPYRTALVPLMPVFRSAWRRWLRSMWRPGTGWRSR